MGKKSAEKFSHGFKNLVKLGVEITNFKITKSMTVFIFSCKTSKFLKERKKENGEREIETEEKLKENKQNKSKK